MTGLWSKIKTYLNISDELLPQPEIEESIRSGVEFKGSQLLTLVFAIAVASVGLNANSIPVIIGAMLISPLMGPIIGMGLAIGIEDFGLLKKGLLNISLAVLGSLVASALYFTVSPQFEESSQLLARTTPSFYDILIALFGGAAGILSIAVKNKGQVMPGVAIATSLMPPLCTAGYGIATLQPDFFFGALYLFFTNMIFIMFATWAGVKLMRLQKVPQSVTTRYHKVKLILYVAVAFTIGMSAFLSFRMFSKRIFTVKASEFVEQQMVFPNTQVLNYKVLFQNGKRIIDVNLIGAELPKDSLQLAMMNKLDSCGLGGTVLNIRQGVTMGSAAMEHKDFAQFFNDLQVRLTDSRQEVDSLMNVIREADGEQSMEILKEVRVLFPSVKNLAVSKMYLGSTQTANAVDTVNVAFINTQGAIGEAEQQKLQQYLQVRLDRMNLHLLVNPVGFPWE
ncbi:MAG: TIGR00341 family protein [Muribaculaceae bacterium]|nr:TIGR00341 family protein [Muribaculaceae bacterium]